MPPLLAPYVTAMRLGSGTSSATLDIKQLVNIYNCRLQLLHTGAVSARRREDGETRGRASTETWN